jgi:hypothetical protein
MRYLVSAIAVIAMLAVSCSKREEEAETVPPGFCKTEGECQPMADRQNAYQQELRQKLISQGVHEKYLPCGKYEVSKAANGFWQVSRTTTGCPSTASQPDPHPDPSHIHK